MTNLSDRLLQNPAIHVNTNSAPIQQRCSWIFPVVALVLSVGLGLFGSYVVPTVFSEFKNFYVSFGIKKPEIIELLLKNSRWLWLMMVITSGFFFAWLRWPWWKNRSAETVKPIVKFLWPFVFISLLDFAIFILVIGMLYFPLVQF